MFAGKDYNRVISGTNIIKKLMIMRKLLLFCLVVVLTFNGWAQTTVTGFVFVDLNGKSTK